MKRLAALLVTIGALILLALPAAAYEPPWPGCEQWIGKNVAEHLECSNAPFNSANTIGGPDVIHGYGGTDILFGGNNADEIFAGPGSDDIFGGDFCKETGYYGFEDRAKRENWVDPSTLVCNVGPYETDKLHGGDGNDFIWESNSDNYSDGKLDKIWCGAGTDSVVLGTEDTLMDPTACENVRVIPVNPDL